VFDGVIFHGNSLIPGSKEILCALRGAGIPYRFITNTSRMTKNNLVEMLNNMGLMIDSSEIFAAPHAAVEYCELMGYNKILLVVPDQEMQEDFSTFQLVENNPDAVVVGDMGQLFTFGLLNKVFRIIINGAELIAMHKNRYWARPDGLALDLGAFVSALEYASNKSAAVMGKPNVHLFNLAVRSWGVSKNSIYMVGDDLETPQERTARLNKCTFGFPITAADLLEAYSNAETKAPKSRANPSGRAQYRFLCIAISSAPFIIILKTLFNSPNVNSWPMSPTTTASGLFSTN
jgi:HAD superfamily hydrolase (TIGR01458 family)